MRTLYVDTETSGVVQGPGGLVEIAVVDENGSVLFEQLVNPMHPINPFCVRIHGITDEMVAHAPTWDEIRPELAALLDGSHFVAHNVKFDRGVVGEAGDGILESTCTVEMCRRKLGYPLKLALAAERAQPRRSRAVAPGGGRRTGLPERACLADGPARSGAGRTPGAAGGAQAGEARGEGGTQGNRPAPCQGARADDARRRCAMVSRGRRNLTTGWRGCGATGARCWTSWSCSCGRRARSSPGWSIWG